MRGPAELKRLIAKKRRRHHKGNGVVGSWAFDDLRVFRLLTCKKFRKTHRRPRDGYQG